MSKVKPVNLKHLSKVNMHTKAGIYKQTIDQIGNNFL